MDKHTCEVHRGWVKESYRCGVFEIGMGGTASRSVVKAAREMGLRAKAGTGGCVLCAKDMVSKLLWGRCDFDLYRTCEYSGNISSTHWRRLAENDPEARFVLLIRGTDRWLESMRKKNKRNMYMNERTIEIYQLMRLHFFDQMAFDIGVWRRAFDRHNEEVLSEENGLLKNRLLVLDVFDTEDDVLWKSLASFIGRKPPKQGTAFPCVKNTRMRMKPVATKGEQ